MFSVIFSSLIITVIIIIVTLLDACLLYLLLYFQYFSSFLKMNSQLNTHITLVTYLLPTIHQPRYLVLCWGEWRLQARHCLAAWLHGVQSANCGGLWLTWWAVAILSLGNCCRLDSWLYLIPTTPTKGMLTLLQQIQSRRYFKPSFITFLWITFTIIHYQHDINN